MNSFSDKVFVATGDPLDESVTTEVIDLANADHVCSGLPDYPMKLDGAMGGLIGGHFPVVCGGLDYGTYHDECFVIGKPDYTEKLLAPRALGYAVNLPDQSLWFTGGQLDYEHVAHV